jgi:hypothetical protein
MVFEGVTEEFLSHVIGLNVTLVALRSQCLRVSFIIAVKRPHICPIPKVKHHVWLEVIEELS